MSEEEKELIGEEKEDEGINIIDYLIVLAKRKIFIITITLSVALITAIISINSQISFYEAYTTILPSRSTEQAELPNQLLIGLGLSSENIRNRNKARILVELLNSRTLRQRLFKRFNAPDDTATEDSEEALNLFFSEINISPNFDPLKKSASRNPGSPLITISVTGNNPQRAAEIANTMVDELKISINNMNASKALQRRIYFEKQLKEASEMLIEAEENIKRFQEKTGALVLGSQKNIAADKFAPALEMEYKRLAREFKFRESLYNIMVKQYEAAKMNETEATFIQVIDKAIPPEKPKKMRTFGGSKAVAAVVFTFLFSCILAFAIEFHKRSSQNNEYKEKIETLLTNLSFKRKT
jgi:uncharacterized protein involved in exopolysaccharide biosynthesis